MLPFILAIAGGYLIGSARKEGATIKFAEGGVPKYDFDLSKIEDIEIDGLDYRDAPDFVDAYISSATYEGREMTDEELEYLNEYYTDFVYDEVSKRAFEGGGPDYDPYDYAKGGVVSQKEVKDYMKSLIESGLMAKGSEKNQTAVNTIMAIISMPKKEYDKYIKDNPNRNVSMIYTEYQDWKQTYKG